MDDSSAITRLGSPSMSLPDTRIAKCPKCDHLLLVSMNQLGRRISCGKCNFAFLIEEKDTYTAVASGATEKAKTPTNARAADISPPPPPPPPPSRANLSAIRRAKITARFDDSTERVFTAGLQGIRSCNCDLIDFDQTNHRIKFSFFVNGRISEHDAYVFEASEGQIEFEIISKDPNTSGMFDPFYEAIVHATQKQLQATAAIARRAEPEEKSVQVNFDIDVDSRRYDDDDRYRRRRRQKQSGPSGLAVAGFVCGLVGLLLICVQPLGIILSILGVVFGGLALSSRQNGLAIAGLVLGVVAIAFLLIIIAAFTSAERHRYYWTDANSIGLFCKQQDTIGMAKIT